MQTSVQYRGSSSSSSASANAAAAASDMTNSSGPSASAAATNRSLTSSSKSASSSSPSSSAAAKSPYRQRRRQVRRKRSGIDAVFDSSSIVSVMLAGFVLFLLVVTVLYRMVTQDAPDPTDELPLEVGTAGSGLLRSNLYPSRAKRREMGEPRPGLLKRMREGTRDILDSLPFGHKVYPKPCPESMDSIGDKTLGYLELRKEIDEVLPVDPERTKAAVTSLRQRDYTTIKPGDMSYDVTNCPLYPPEGYPHAWPVLDVVNNWPPDDPTPRPKIFQGLCIFDYDTELEKAKIYQNAEVPFLMRDDPSVLRTAERWNHPGYMSRLMGDVKHRTEYSPNNHFMYWNNPNPKKRPDRRGRKWPKPPEGWTPPTKLTRMPYKEWLDHANTTDDNLGPDKPHWYYRLIGCGATGRCDRDSSEYLYDEMPFFQPRDDSFYLVEPDRQKGIHCRWGMKGVIAENHFDGSRNAIAVMGGERRYVLAHPAQCPSLALYPKAHPSARHSAVDWSDPDLETYPEFRDALVNEVVLQAGDVLYLPTNWFHFIVSLELNFQCNTRSGISGHYMEPIKECGF